MSVEKSNFGEVDQILSEHVNKLTNYRETPLIALFGPINRDCIPYLYQCLKNYHHLHTLDFLLSTTGGDMLAVNRIITVIRQFADEVNILIPYQALSAGTLMCLGSNRIVATSMAEFSPIDPNLISESAGLEISLDNPPSVSSEDIRLFKQMATEWFCVQPTEEGLQMLALLGQRIFPPTLTSFYRSFKVTKRIAEEIICYHLPKSEEAERQQIVTCLMEEFYHHNYLISRSDMAKIGLHIKAADDYEEELLWLIDCNIRSCLDKVHVSECGTNTLTKNFLFARDSAAKKVQLLYKNNEAELYDNGQVVATDGYVWSKYELESNYAIRI